MKNYYTVLGVEEDSTPAAIKSAFRKLAREWHPDKNDSPEANERFQEINEAYQILGDEQKKQKYDYQRKSNFSGDGFTFKQQHAAGRDFRDIFEDFFTWGANQQSANRQQSRPIFNVQCTLEEVYNGCSKPANGRMINVPKGMRNGTLFQINNDLIRVSVTPHRSFSVNGDSLMASVSVDAFEAMIGTEVTVNHLDGKKYTFDIPAGTQHESVLRVRGRGMPNPQIPDKFGDFLIICKVSIPKDLTDEQKNSIIKHREIKKYTI